MEAVGALLLAGGFTYAEIAARTGVPRDTVRYWKRLGIDRALGGMRDRAGGHPCDGACDRPSDVPHADYAYLLGMYLGDGCISAGPRGVFRLRIACCLAYPNIIEECAATMRSVLPNTVGRVMGQGCLEVYSNSKHWPCLFPQHGPGRKHDRPIVLEPWQEAVALDRQPDKLVRGLIHSDGCRVINSVVRPVGGEKKRYTYVRYHFTNRSADIKAIFVEACRRLGVDARPNNAMTISVARRESVSILEEIVGPKR